MRGGFLKPLNGENPGSLEHLYGDGRGYTNTESLPERNLAEIDDSESFLKILSPSMESYSNSESLPRENLAEIVASGFSGEVLHGRVHSQGNPFI